MIAAFTLLLPAVGALPAVAQEGFAPTVSAEEADEATKTGPAEPKAVSEPQDPPAPRQAPQVKASSEQGTNAPAPEPAPATGRPAAPAPSGDADRTDESDDSEDEEESDEDDSDDPGSVSASVEVTCSPVPLVLVRLVNDTDGLTVFQVSSGRGAVPVPVRANDSERVPLPLRRGSTVTVRHAGETLASFAVPTDACLPEEPEEPEEPEPPLPPTASIAVSCTPVPLTLVTLQNPGTDQVVLIITSLGSTVPVPVAAGATTTVPVPLAPGTVVTVSFEGETLASLTPSPDVCENGNPGNGGGGNQGGGNQGGGNQGGGNSGGGNQGAVGSAGGTSPGSGDAVAPAAGSGSDAGGEAAPTSATAPQPTTTETDATPARRLPATGAISGLEVAALGGAALLLLGIFLTGGVRRRTA